MTEGSAFSPAGTASVAHAVAQSSDAAGLHAPVPALMLELQSIVGALAGTVTAATERGRRPFRPTPDWTGRLGELAYSVYLLADQTGVDVTAAVLATAEGVTQQARQSRAADATEWPVHSP